MEPAASDILFEGPRFDEPDLDRLSATIKRVSGITLPGHRRSMVASRLGRRLRDLRMGSLSEYLPLLDDASGDEMASMLDAIVTNKTEFFREPDHFAHLRDTVITPIGRKGAGDCRIHQFHPTRCGASRTNSHLQIRRTVAEEFSMVCGIHRIESGRFDHPQVRAGIRGD